MIDHIAIKVADLQLSIAFYESALAPLGYVKLMEHEISGAGFGRDGKPVFWVQPGGPSGPLHIAIAAADHDTAKRFHAAALAAGGTDNGAPGPRIEYHPGYYGAFVLDPDGNNIEAVCHFSPDID